MTDKVILIYDSFINLHDVELFLCRTTEVDFKWFRKDLVPHDLLKQYIDKKTTEIYTIKTCNTDKSKIFACEMKCKTRGVQLACSDSGIVLAFRELYGAESCTQVAQMYIDLCKSFIGNMFNFISYVCVNSNLTRQLIR